MLVSTLNRTFKSYLFAILGAEHIMRWLPKGTHDWDKFITPEEFSHALNEAGFEDISFKGLAFDLLHREWQIKTQDTEINYLGKASKSH